MTEKKKKKLKIRKGSDASQRRNMLSKFISLLSRGKTRDEIEIELELAPEQYDDILEKYYKGAEEEHGRKSPLRIFVEIVIKKNQLIRDLEELKKHIKDKTNFKNPQAYVAAIRTQSDTYDSLIKLGQDLNLIVRAAGQIVLVDNKDIRDMNPDELSLALQREFQDVQKMIDKKPGQKKNKVISFPNLAEQSGE
jgi:hypothetical protein